MNAPAIRYDAPAAGAHDDIHCPWHGAHAGQCGGCVLDARARELAPAGAKRQRQDFVADYRAAAIAAIEEDDLGQRAMALRNMELLIDAAADRGIRIPVAAIDEELRPRRFAAIGIYAAALIA